jgi:DNA/RNA-binding domain of Phe-tRNA-synthetase-like protein
MTEAPVAGFVAPAVAAEFPGLRLRWATAPAAATPSRPSPPELRRRLGELSNRYHGGGVVTMRTHAVPHAYRTFYRQIGLDPDVDRIPSERAAVARLLHGGFRSVDLVSDACLVALVETGVPVWAVDGDGVDAEGLGIRTCAPGEGPPAGTLVVADGSRIHAVLFADPLPESAVSPRTRRLALYSVAVDGVPNIHVEEALWLVLDLLGEPDDGC